MAILTNAKIKFGIIRSPNRSADIATNDCVPSEVARAYLIPG